MNFTTPIFIFIFFPVALSVFLLAVYLEQKSFFSYYFSKLRIKDLSLIGLSMFFYMWALFDNVIKFAVYIIMVWLAGKCIGYNRKKYVRVYLQDKDDRDSTYKNVSLAVFVLFISVVIIIFYLVRVKYMFILADIWNRIFGGGGYFAEESILAPIGISFITFSAISYLTDICRGDASEGTLIDCALYLSFFPKVISGPIVLWKDFQGMFKKRVITWDSFVTGLNRIMIGFAKKLILADQFGLCISEAIAGEADIVTGWGMALLYMLQIYYDFSGYSDIAIGLARLLGFEFKDNFNFPYRSKSISEFWRRWHISLGTWFREYIYFPLGGSRKGERRALWNVAVVFALTGIWHGAGWNYILWGGINGIIVMIERLIRNKSFYKKQPDILKWLITMGITFFCWQFFRFQNFPELCEWLKLMFGILPVEKVYFSSKYYFDTQIITLAAVGVVGSVLFGNMKLREVYQKLTNGKIGFFVQEVVLLLLFVIAILFMINSTYSPFIYFQY